MNLRAPAKWAVLSLCLLVSRQAAAEAPASPIGPGDVIFTEFFDGWHRLDPLAGSIAELPWPAPPVSVDSIRFDLDGAVLFDNGDDAIFRLDPRTGSVVSLGVPGLGGLSGFLVEPSGDLLIANGGAVSRFSRDTKLTTTVTTGEFFAPSGIAQTESGRVFLTEFFNDLLEVDPTTGATSPVTTTDLSIPSRIVTRSDGDLVLQNFVPSELVRVDPDSGIATLFSADLPTFVNGIATDESDNVWLTSTEAVLRYGPDGGAPTTVVSEDSLGDVFFSPGAIAVVPSDFVAPPQVPEPSLVVLVWPLALLRQRTRASLPC